VNAEGGARPAPETPARNLDTSADDRSAEALHEHDAPHFARRIPSSSRGVGFLRRENWRAYIPRGLRNARKGRCSGRSRPNGRTARSIRDPERTNSTHGSAVGREQEPPSITRVAAPASTAVKRGNSNSPIQSYIRFWIAVYRLVLFTSAYLFAQLSHGAKSYQRGTYKRHRHHP
jgi:hypothetical protein